MERFSERYGYKKARDTIQLDSMDEALRNSLWNMLIIHYWKPAETDTKRSYDISVLTTLIWRDFYKQPLDKKPGPLSKYIEGFRLVYFNMHWAEVYDLVEFISERCPGKENNKGFRIRCNEVLERELSAYRFVEDKITRIVDPEEIDSIENAIEYSSDPVKVHLNSALEKLSDRDNPDYRNSIKESISAVESLVMEATNQKDDFTKLLKILEKNIDLHPALKKAFSNLYGYTSDKDGLRHAIKDKSNTDFEDAKFMLVTCSAFINYVRGKLNK